MEKYTFNTIFRPKRLLYYSSEFECGMDNIDTEETLPEELTKYNGAFGTYDFAGTFEIVESDGTTRRVAGIEYRDGDDRIAYPEDLECMALPAMYMMSVDLNEFFEGQKASVDGLLKEFDYISNHMRNIDYVIHSDIPHKPIAQVFWHEGKTRMLMPIRLSEGLVERNIEEIDSFTKEELYSIAYREPVTGYYNWNHLNSMFLDFDGYGIQDFCFVHFDVKDFKLLNEAYSHYIANGVLRKIAETMQKHDWIYSGARCDNDNFAMIIRDMPKDEIVEKLTEFFDEVSVLDEDPNYKIYYRCGVTQMRNALNHGNIVADCSKMAQSMCNDHNKTEIKFYTDEMYEELRWAKFIKKYLVTAVENDEFLINLQPQYDLDTGRLCGAEALIRWHYKHERMLPPYRFIPYFEKDGSIGQVDDIVLAKVCQHIRGWLDEGISVPPISVNLSRRRLGQPDLVDHLESIVDSYNVPHKYIDFELTESAAYDDLDNMLTIMQMLKERGFIIALDDFGTGFSSLSLLTRMPIDILKIDKSFVDEIAVSDEETKETRLVGHIITMAKDMDLTCLAEGAETLEQVDRLKSMGCERIQGYYFGKPMPVDEFEELMKK